MKEDEARLKKCHDPSPWVQEHGGWCIASDCMMWRWDIRCTVKYDEFGYADDIEENEIDTGYCGLGGKQ